MSVYPRVRNLHLFSWKPWAWNAQREPNHESIYQRLDAFAASPCSPDTRANSCRVLNHILLFMILRLCKFLKVSQGQPYCFSYFYLPLWTHCWKNCRNPVTICWADGTEIAMLNHELSRNIAAFGRAWRQTLTIVTLRGSCWDLQGTNNELEMIFPRSTTCKSKYVVLKLTEP